LDEYESACGQLCTAGPRRPAGRCEPAARAQGEAKVWRCGTCACGIDSAAAPAPTGRAERRRSAASCPSPQPPRNISQHICCCTSGTAAQKQTEKGSKWSKMGPSTERQLGDSNPCCINHVVVWLSCRQQQQRRLRNAGTTGHNEALRLAFHSLVSQFLLRANLKAGTPHTHKRGEGAPVARPRRSRRAEPWAWALPRPPLDTRAPVLPPRRAAPATPAPSRALPRHLSSHSLSSSAPTAATAAR
jgi:hypothetical protein